MGICETVKELQWYLGELPFEFIYDLHRWKFLCNRNNMSDAVIMLMDISNLQFGYLDHLSRMYGTDSVNKKHCVYDKFFSDIK